MIVGSTARALTGLQFVVLALVANAEALGSSEEIRAFGLRDECAVARAFEPGQRVRRMRPRGVIYAGTIIRHARTETCYSPDTADWCWYAILPLVTYATLLGAGKALPWQPAAALLVVAGTSLSLLFIGIHNAWETVTYDALTHMPHMPQFKRTKDRGESGG